VPLAPVLALIGLSNVLRGMSRAGASRLAAVAGGLAEMLAVCGIGAILIGRATAVLLLFRDSRQEIGCKTCFPSCRYA
jgi:hypothetical protein